MTDLERVELAIRRVLARFPATYDTAPLRALADELAKMIDPQASQGEVINVDNPGPGYKLNWVP